MTDPTAIPRVFHDHYEQGSAEWTVARIGKITASRFGEVMTLAKSNKDREAGKLSDSASSYLDQVVGEVLTGKAHELPDMRMLQWGNEHEPIARQVYEARTGNKVRKVGFVELEGFDIGCSPDGLVGEKGITEIKCPFKTCHHVKYLRKPEIPKKYFWQIVGEMFVTGADWADFVSFDPRIKNIDRALVIIRVKRDDKLMSDLWKQLQLFHSKLQEFKGDS